MSRVFYKSIINPFLEHFDIVIVCDRNENDYIDILCKLLKKKYFIEVIDLNELFSTGRVGEIYIDRKKIRDNAVDIRRNAVKQEHESLATSRDGRLKLVQSIMTKKEKIKKLNELGITVHKEDEDNLNRLLIDAWVDDDD
ncbi:MAG: hypothetical protein NC489_24340 [Ruminococcus flavefaciens]|nr:hypothetical protein [Ruminococcus flavefaciens]